MSWLPPLSSLAFVAAGTLLLVAWVVVILRARRDGEVGATEEASTGALPRWAVVAASVAPPLAVSLVLLAAGPRFGELRVALEGLSFEVGPQAVAEVRIGGSPEFDHLVVRDLPPGFLTFRATTDGTLVADLHPQTRTDSASPAGEEPDRAFALAKVDGGGDDDGELANSFEIGEGDRLRLAGGGELVFDADRPALGSEADGYPELSRRTGRAGVPIARQLPPEAEILPVRYYGARSAAADFGTEAPDSTGGSPEAGQANDNTTVLVGIGGTPLGAFLYRGGGYLRSDFRIALPGPEVELVRAEDSQPPETGGDAEVATNPSGDANDPSGTPGTEPQIAAFDPRLATLEPGDTRRFALYRVDYAPPPREDGDARSRIQERRSFQARWHDGRLELVLDTPSHVQLGKATLAAAAEGGDGPPLLALMGKPDAAAAMEDDPSLLAFPVLGGPLAAELFSRIRVDGDAVRATTHTGARSYRVGEAFRVGDRSAAVLRVSRLGVPWGTMLLVWATAVAALLAGWSLRHRPLPLLILTGVEFFLALRLLIAYQGAFLDPGAAEAAWISVAAWAWVPWVLQAFLALHQSWRASLSPGVLAHLAVVAGAAVAALLAAGSEVWKVVLVVVMPPLLTATLVFAVRWFEGDGHRGLLGRLPGWQPDAHFDFRRWVLWVGGLTASLVAFRVFTEYGAGWKERVDLGVAALAVSIYYTPAALAILALAWGGRRRRWGVFVALGALAALFAVPAAARDWGTFLIFSLPPVLLFALAALEPSREHGDSAPTDRAPAWQRWLWTTPLVAVLLLHVLGVFVLPRVFGAGPSNADLDAARSSPQAARELLQASVAAEANSLRVWSWAAPEALQRVGTSSSEGLQVVMATLEAYATRGPWGRGYLGVPLSSALDATHLDDNLSAIHVLGTFGWLGALVLLAALSLWAMAPLLLPRPASAASVPWSPRGAFGLMILWTFTCAGMYMFSANVGLMLFTGKNVYFLAAASLSDVVEGTLLAALALWALCALPRSDAGVPGTVTDEGPASRDDEPAVTAEAPAR